MPFIFLRSTLFSLILLCVSACSLFTPHKMDINQGTPHEQSTLDKLRLGMTKEQVMFLLGSPSSKNIYTEGRWDYVNTLESSQSDNVNKQLALWFKGDTLERVAAKGYNVSHLQGEQALRIAPRKLEPKRTIPTPQASKPLPAPVAKYTPEQRIKEAINAWANAWNNQNINDYVSHYVSGYTPSKSLSHTTWLERRKIAINQSNSITVNLSDTNIEWLNEHTAVVQLTQRNQSDQNTVIKSLLMVKQNNQWLIQKETTLKDVKD